MPPTRLRSLLVLAAGFLLAAFFALLAGSGLLARPDWVAYHAMFEARGPLPPPDDVSIVAIDELSLEELGAWPLPRETYAALVDGLVTAGARVVALDVAFPQPQSPAADRDFAAALARHPGRVVLAANWQPLLEGAEGSEKLVLPLPAFREAAGWGVVNFPLDADGAIHRLEPRHATGLAGFETVDSFDLAIARRVLKPLPGWLSPPPDSLLINYAGPPGHFRTASLSVVLDAIRRGDRAYMSRFDGDVVFLGASSWRLQDLYPTPFSATALGGGARTLMPGVEVHANALATLLRGDPLRPLPLPFQAGALALLGLGGAWALTRLTPWRGLALLGLALVLLAALAQLLFARGLWWPVTAPVGLLMALYVGAVIHHFTLADATRRVTRRTFERYVAPEIVSEILKNPDLAPRLGGERREVTVLFSDVRSFTTISERLSPEEVVAFLNAYLTAMADVILSEGGCIDKYIGDAILAVWGNVNPLPPEEAAARAVRAALAMKARVAALQGEWEAQGFPRIEIGVGVNTGPAIVGNIGSPRRLEFGVIGDSINVASRLEGLTKDYGGAVLISGRTRELLGDRFACDYMGEVKVKGRQAAVPVYTVAGTAGARPVGA